MRLSGLGVILHTERSWVQFLVRILAWVEREINVSLPLFLPPFAPLKINKIFFKMKERKTDRQGTSQPSPNPLRLATS